MTSRTLRQNCISQVAIDISYVFFSRFLTCSYFYSSLPPSNCFKPSYIHLNFVLFATTAKPCWLASVFWDYFREYKVTFLLLFFALTMTYDINWAAAGVDSAIST
jgi:hypothetical protein